VLRTRFGTALSDWRHPVNPSRLLRTLGAMAVISILVVPHAPRAGAADAPAKSPAATVWVTLGTSGGPRPKVRRGQPANALVVNGTTYLIDAGNGVARELTVANIPFRDVHTIFITHQHNDHNADLGTLVSLIWTYTGQTTAVYGPPGTKEIAAAAGAYFQRNRELRASEGGQQFATPLFDVHEITAAGPVYRDANVTVTCVENSHFANVTSGTPAFGRDKSFAYKFVTADRTIVFTGDTGPSAAVTQLARGADLLVSEVVDPASVPALVAGFSPNITAAERDSLVAHFLREHMVPEEIGKMAAAAGVKAVVLTHLSGNDNETDFTKYTAPVQMYFHGPVTVAEDGMRF
jgi:ribonuclease BN (tRNA processing enzyme)